MSIGPLALLLIGLSTVVLTLLAVWAREEFIQWQGRSHHREQDRRARRRDH